MTPAPKRVERITVAEYLRREWEAEERHNYLDGVVFPVDGPVAMAGESRRHGTVSANLVGELHAQLKGRPCQAFVKDTKVRSGPPGPRPLREAAGMYSYPDVAVVCGDPEYDDDRSAILLNPAAIFEVLSPSTEAFDRGEKFTRFQVWNPSLADYLLVSQDKPRVEHYTRQSGKSWQYTAHDGLDAVVSVPSIGCTLRLADIYDRVTFPEPPPEEADDPAQPPG